MDEDSLNNVRKSLLTFAETMTTFKYLVTGTVPVFADVFPIFWKTHSCDQFLFGKSGGPLDGLID